MTTAHGYKEGVGYHVAEYRRALLDRDKKIKQTVSEEFE